MITFARAFHVSLIRPSAASRHVTGVRHRRCSDLDTAAIDSIARLLVRHRIDGVIATNTTIGREGVGGERHADELGGLSGKPLREKSTGVIRTLARALDGALPIIGVGGIFSGADACEKIDAGAALVQLYTGLIYRGPALVAECVKALAGRPR